MVLHFIHAIRIRETEMVNCDEAEIPFLDELFKCVKLQWKYMIIEYNYQLKD